MATKAKKTSRQRSTSLEDVQESPTTSKDVLEEFRKFGNEWRLEMKGYMRELKEEISQDMRREFGELKEKVTEELREMKDTILDITKELAQIGGSTKILQTKVNKVEQQLQVTEEKLDKELSKVKLDIDVRARTKCVKLRGIRERPRENLTETVVPILAEFIGWEVAQLDLEVDKIYRVNSAVATRQHLPRDIAVHFIRERVRDLVIQQSYKNRITVEGSEIIILKDFPYEVLAKRRNYKDLTQALRERLIKYKWAREEGVIFSYKFRRYVIDTVEKAEEFLRRLSQEDEQNTSSEGRYFRETSELHEKTRSQLQISFHDEQEGTDLINIEEESSLVPPKEIAHLHGEAERGLKALQQIVTTLK